MLIPVSTLAFVGRNLLRNRNRTYFALLTVGGGVVAFLLSGGFIAWILDASREAAIHSQFGHAQIVRSGFFERGLATPYSFLLPSSSTDKDHVESLPGVKLIAPRLVFNGLISREDATMAFSGEGIDPVSESALASSVKLISGDDLTDSRQRKILLGEGLARNLGAKAGDAVVLLASGVKGRPAAVEVTVAGIFMTATKDYDDYAVRMPIETTKKLMGVDGATSWVVLLDRTEDTASIVSQVRTILPADRFEVVPWRDLADFFVKTEALFTKQVSVVKWIIGAIIILTISNILTMNVLERTVEVGTCLALGLPRGGVMRLFMLEGLVLGLAGGITGILVAYGLSEIISKIGIPMPPPPGMAHGYVGQIIVTFDLILEALLLAVVTTSLASIFPAWKAARMNIVDALRYNQ